MTRAIFELLARSNAGRALAYGALLLLLGVAPGAFAQVVGTSRTRIHDPESATLQKLLNDAQDALNQKDFAAAAQKYQAYLAKQPNNAYAHFQLGYAYTAMQRPQDARNEYAKAIELDPKMGPAYTNLGMTLLDLKQPGDAVAPLEKAAALAPADAHAKFMVGVALEGAGKRAEAIEQYQAAENLDPNDPQIHEAIGQALLDAGRAGDAEGEFRALVALQPNSGQAHLGLARALVAEKKANEASAQIQDYLKTQPNDVDAHIEDASILINAGKYDEGLAELDRADAIRQPDASALNLRAQAYLGEKKNNAAIPVLRRLIALNPSDQRYAAALGHALIETKDYAGALNILIPAYKAHPDSVEVLTDIATAEYQQGNCPATLQALSLLSQHRPLPAAGWYVRASCYDKLGQPPPALDAYRKFLAMNADLNSDMYFAATARVRVLEREVKEKKK